jgi:hypothetical protein
VMVCLRHAGMFIKTKRVRRANRTYEYLTLVESVRVDGKNTHRTLFRLGEASALRETGELDRIIAALTGPRRTPLCRRRRARGRAGTDDRHDGRGPPPVGRARPRAAVRPGSASEAGCAFSLADAVFAMLAGRLVDPASKRRTHRWIVDDVVAPDGFSFPTLDQYYRALDVVCEHKDLIERHVYAAVCDLTNLNLTLACYDLTSSYLEGDPAPHPGFRPRRSATPATGVATGRRW